MRFNKFIENSFFTSHDIILLLISISFSQLHEIFFYPIAKRNIYDQSIKYVCCFGAEAKSYG